MLTINRSKSLDRIYPTDNTQYFIIDNFDNVSEDDCIKCDERNNDLYKKNYELYREINEKMLKNGAMFKIDNPPSTPIKPNNHERFILFRERNVDSISKANQK